MVEVNNPAIVKNDQLLYEIICWELYMIGGFYSQLIWHSDYCMVWTTKVVMVHLLSQSRDIYLLQSMQTSCGAHQASCSVGAGP